MSLAAAIGYAMGIIVFALIIRHRRKKMINNYIEQAETNQSKSDKGSQND